MPVYEYRCDACNIQFDLRQKFSDPPADRCPQCGRTVRKLVSAVSFSLKGGGWYGDGYGPKVESATTEGEKTDGTGAKTEVASTDSTPTESTTSPATQETAPTQIASKTNATEPPTTTKDKAEAKSQCD